MIIAFSSIRKDASLMRISKQFLTLWKFSLISEFSPLPVELLIWPSSTNSLFDIPCFEESITDVFWPPIILCPPVCPAPAALAPSCCLKMGSVGGYQAIPSCWTWIILSQFLIFSQRALTSFWFIDQISLNLFLSLFSNLSYFFWRSKKSFVNFL